MEKKRTGSKKASRKESVGLKDALFFYSKLSDLKKEIAKNADANTLSEKRLLDVEVHLNLLTRLLTTLCVEKFGIRAMTLKRLVRRIEKEAFRDSQIMELESLYSLSHPPQKKTSTPHPKVKDDPWDQIS